MRDTTGSPLPKHVLYIILFLLPVSLSGQQLKRYTFTHFNSASGLVSNQVHSIVQDETGYIWIATTDGLQRFDGIRYKSFRHQDGDEGSLPSNAVTQLMIDNRQNLWLLLADGKAGIFNTRTYTFREVAVKPKNPLSVRSNIKRLIQDEYGHIFLLLFGNEVLTWNENSNEFSPKHNFFLQKEEWGIADFIQQPGTDNYWIAVRGAGIAVYNNKTRQLSYAGHNAENIKAIDQFEGKVKPANLFFDKKGRLWFDSWEPGYPNIYCYDPEKNETLVKGYGFLSLFKTYYETRGFFEQRDGTVWIKGLKVMARYIEKEKRFEQVFNGYENEKDIAFRVITCLFEDREKNIWAGTGNNGLFRFNPNREFFTNVAHVNRITGMPGEGSPISFIRENDGSILVSHWGDGLYRYDKNFNPVPVNIKGIAEKNPPSIWDMCPSKDSNIIWMACQPGLFAFDQKKRAATYYNPAIMQNRTTREIAEDRKGNLWLGMQSIGLFKWNKEKGKRKFVEGVSKFTAVPDVQVNNIKVDSKGYVWVATSAEGLFVIDPETDRVVIHFHTKGSGETKLPEDGVSSILEYDDSLVAITTSTRLLIYNRLEKKTTLIGQSDNISGNITSMEKDYAGHLWVSTTSALYRINIRKKVFISFNRNDGMTNDYFILSSSYTLPGGKMLFGTSAQFIAFDPVSIRINPDEHPPVVITDFKLMNRSLLIDSLLGLGKVELKPGENSLEIEFSYLNYIRSYVIKYKLEGLDKNWKIADENNRAIYSYLPPRTYTLLLTTIDAEGNSGTNVTRLTIEINPPFWKTWWFFCLLALAIAAGFYWLDKQRISKLLALQKVRTEIAGNLHEEVNTTLNNISLLSEMARIKAGKDAERSKEYIDQISDKSQNMITAMDDILWCLDPGNDNMERSLLRMMEYADTLKNIHGANIEIALDKKVKRLKLDMKMRHEILLIFKHALRVIVQYAEGKKVLAHIDLFKNKLSVRLEDAVATLENNTAETDECIKDMHTRSSEIGAELDVQYNKPGVVILLLVPVR
ncbi:MAG TPA: two-component regulator propeller domain-containing protein [Chitinophagaceae bacterium]